MTNKEFISLVKEPENVKAEHAGDLKVLVELYPNFTQARILLIKAMQQSHSIHFAANLKLAALYSSNRRLLFYYIYPEKKLSTEHYRREHTGKSGDYFEMLDVIAREGGDTGQSLKKLADRLKSARTMVVKTSDQQVKKHVEEIKSATKTVEINEQIVTQIIPETIVEDVNIPLYDDEKSESNAIKFIQNRKYKQAVEILRTLNLNNPKKSVYFADQIRFLEKVIANSKK